MALAHRAAALLRGYPPALAWSMRTGAPDTSGDLLRAVEAFDKVLEINPHHERAKEARERLAGRGVLQTL